jgi:predicted dehydrogenase
MVNIAIIGSGFIGDIHASIYKKIKNVNIIAFSDIIEERAKSLAEKYAAKYYFNNDQIFESNEIDCIDICTPPNLHAELSIKAAESKKHIFCEKAIALSVEDANKVIDSVEKNKVKAMSGHVLRFWPEYIKTKEILESNELGKPLNIACHRLIVTPDWNPNRWWLDESKSGGIGTEVLIHDLDILIWFLGKPKYVKADGNFNKDMGGFYHMDAIIDFKNGSKGLAEAGWGFMGNFPFTAVLRVLCENGAIEWQLKAGKNIEDRPNSPLIVYKKDGSKLIAPVLKEDAFMLELTYFIDCIENNKDIEQATFYNAKSALELTLAAKKSALENRTVEL